MTNTQKFIAHIRDLIAKDDFKTAIQQLSALLKDSPCLDEAVQQSARYNNVLRQIRLGLVDFQSANIAQNQIRYGVLELLREIEEQEQAQPSIKAEVERFAVVHQKNTLIHSQIQGRDIHIGDIIQYKDQQIPRFLTNPPFNSDYFIGREQDLSAIETEYTRNNRLLMLVNGEGGIGKTTLAAKYWYAHQDRYKYLAWCYSDSGIGTALLSLAGPLNIRFENENEKAQIAKITEGVNNLEKPCLLVFDNANNALDLDKHYSILHQLTQCHILLTSRAQRTDDMPTLKVKPLEKDDVIRLFKHYYRALTDAELPLLEAILHAVGYNTLVAEVLAKNLAVFNRFSTQYSLANLLADLQQKGLLALKNKTVKVMYGSDTLRIENPNDIIAAMYDLVNLSDAERYLLSNFAVLPADNIAYETLKMLLQKTDDALDTPLSSLEEKGWIELRTADQSFKISPVIQEITKTKNADRLLVDCRTLIKVLKEGLAHANRHIGDDYKQATYYAALGEAVINAVLMPHDEMATLCQNIGEFHKDTGNLSRMKTAYQKMLDIQNALCATEPDNPDFKNGLAISYQLLGNTHTSLGNLETALSFYEEDIKLSKELYAAYPNNVDFKNGLAISYEKLGETHTSLGNLDKALEFYEEDIKLSKELYAAYPNNVDFKNGLAVSYQNLGITHTSLGNLETALGVYEDCNRLEKELYAAYPNNVQFKSGLAISYSKLGNTHTSLGNLDKALEFYEDCNRLEKELYAAYPNNVDFKNGLAISYSKLGETHMFLGNLETALGFYEEDIKLSKELHAAYPNNVQFKNLLAISYQWLGFFYEQQMKNRVKAKEQYTASEKLLIELASSFPKYIEFQNNLKWVQNRLKALD